MNESFISAEATRLGMVHLAAAVDEYGVIILHESTASRAQLIRIFEIRLRRAEARDDREVTRLVADLLSAFNGAQSSELELSHVQAGKMDVMLYGEAGGESVLAAVILSDGDS